MSYFKKCAIIFVVCLLPVLLNLPVITGIYTYAEDVNYLLTSEPTFGEKELRAQINDVHSQSVSIAIPFASEVQAAALSNSLLMDIIQKGKNLIVKGSNTTLVFDPVSINTESIKAGGYYAKVRVGMEPAEAGAISQRVGIGAQAYDGNMLAAEGKGYKLSFQIIKGDNSEEVNDFYSPVNVSISLKDAYLDDINTENLGAYALNESTNEWEYMGGKYNAADRSFTFKTKSFGIFSIFEYSKSFSDVKDHWARNSIEKMAAKHIASGVGKDRFDPDGAVTRAEFACWLVRALELKQQGTQTKLPYKDVSSSKWYTGELEYAYSAGLITTEDGLYFKPDERITREDMGAMIGRAAKFRTGTPGYDSEQAEKILQRFTDNNDISQSVKELVAIAVNLKVISGRTAVMFAPKADATRAEGLVMIRRFLLMTS